MFESLLALCLGIGLAASCGFRVFVPLLIIAVAVRVEVFDPAAGFEWLGTWPALLALATATALEVGAYYIPWLDNLLDSITAPAAVIAGTIAVAASVREMDPLVKWAVAIIAGGGAAGTIKAGTASARGMSSLTTGGLGNAVVSTLEWVASLALALLSLLVPVLAALLGLLLAVVLGRFAARLVRRWRQRADRKHAGRDVAGN